MHALSYKHLKLKSKVYGMVNHYAMKMTTTCSLFIGHFCDTNIVKPLKDRSIDKLKYK